MNVLRALIIAIVMQIAPILMGHLHVPVSRGTLDLEASAQVSDNPSQRVQHDLVED